MNKSPAVLILSTIFVILLGIFISVAGGQHGATVLLSSGIFISVFTLCGALIYCINWFFYVPAAIQKTEKYYDLVGSFTYLSVVLVALYFTPELSARAKLVVFMVIIWAFRLGAFLFIRIHRAGSDDRFDDVKINPLKFLLAWTLQALWVLLTVACALAIITSHQQPPMSGFAVLGVLLWGVGFVLEVVADQQKTQFRKDPANQNQFISSGLWAWSQHPNYFGEILLWLGVAILSIPVLMSWQYCVLLSPFFVCLLLIKGSGIPTLKEKAEKRWGNDPSYIEYTQSTPLIIPARPKL